MLSKVAMLVSAGDCWAITVGSLFDSWGVLYNIQLPFIILYDISAYNGHAYSDIYTLSYIV